MEREDVAKDCREAYWSELTLENRIERMRMVVKRMQCQVDDLVVAMERMEAHVHAEGHVAFRITGVNRPDLRFSVDRPSDQTYF